MRSAVQRLKGDPKIIEPLVPVDLVVDHSVQVDFFGSAEALRLNLEMEFKRNRERYQFLKWGQQAFKTFQLIPPGIGIVHQVNLEYLAKGVLSAKIDNGEIFYPDTLVGTDSHTTMINGLGVVGWGVGGIEAEAGMLGQPVYFLTPEVVGVHLTGKLREGVTATDLVLHITQMLRAQKVVGKFVEFYGEGAASLPVPDRATIGNMSPEYGATMGFFPVDQESVAYLRATGRTDEQCAAFENYFRAQKMFGMPRKGEIDYSVDLALDLADVQPGVAGPKRPQDRINLPDLGETFRSLLQKPVKDGGYGKKDVDLSAKHLVQLNGTPPSDGDMPSTDKANQGIEPGEERNKVEMVANRPTPDTAKELKDSTADPFHHGQSRIGHGSVLIAAITSCTNTSNPSVMLAAGLLAKKAVERGLPIDPAVKTSLAPGSRVVTDYLHKTGLQTYLDQLGFNRRRLRLHDLHRQFRAAPSEDRESDQRFRSGRGVGAFRKSQFRSARAPKHQSELSHVAAAGGRVRFGRTSRCRSYERADRQGQGRQRNTFLRDLWPSLKEIRDAMESALTPEVFRKLYRDFADQNPKWNEIPSSAGEVYQWDEKSDYIHEPPFFKDFSMEPGHIGEIRGARRSEFSATRSRPITFRRRARSSRRRRPANIWCRAESSRKISTATAAGAETIWS